MPKLHRIVLTGGPCGGKSTALSRIAEELRQRGLAVYVVPEIPTIAIVGGLSFEGLNPAQFVEIEGHILRMQLAMEDGFLGLARASGKDAAVICDRGALDVKAYLPPASWQAVLDDNGWSVTALRDGRYDAVIHLVTAADGAEAFYTTANNEARKEGPELARTLDRAVRDAWVGHPHLRVIDNSTGFDAKVERVISAVDQVLGVPAPVEIERKYLVKSAPIGSMPVHSEAVEIEQIYLKAGAGQPGRIRRRGHRGSHVYFHTAKGPLVDGARSEVERQIGPGEYVTLAAEADPGCRPVRKRRHCFVWEGQYLELDEFIDPRPGLLLLEIEVSSMDAPVSIPPFLAIEREVTNDPEFQNHRIARG
jgi:CYTH domain-containing protein/predicted ATPase